MQEMCLSRGATVKCKTPNCSNEAVELIMGVASPGKFLMAEELVFKFCVDCLSKKIEEIKKI